THQVTAGFIFVAVPVRVLVVVEFLRCGWSFAVVHGGRRILKKQAPAAVRAVVLSETGAYDFVSFLLRFDVDGRVNGETALSYARRVLVFELLANEFNRIIKRRRLVLRLVVSGVGELNRLRLSGVSFGLAGETVFRHQIEHEIATFFRLRRV